MDSLYTPEVAHAFRTAPWPKKLKWRVEEIEEPFPMLMLYVSEANVKSLDGEDITAMTAVVNDVLGKLNRDGIPVRFGVLD